MKRILRLYDDDIRDILMEHFDCTPDEIISVYTEDYDEENNVVKPIFYIEIEEKNNEERN